MSDDHVRNENSGAVSGVSFQARDVHGDVTVQQRRTADADELLAGNLAEAVREQSRKEEDQWRVGDPAPLSVRWHSAEQDLFDRWENIQAKTSPEHADPVPLSGQFAAIRETFQATGSQRLLVLGRAGAGKTVLAHRLILDLLDHRDPRGPIPVLFSLNDWNPTTTGLREWLANRLVRDHSFLDQHDTTGKRSAELLVDRDWILPVLDGFDELPAQHHDAAIRESSSVKWPLVVTSRPTEYARAAREVKAIGRAAAIELEDLTLEQAEHYLRRSASPSRATEWQAVFERLRNAPDDAASQNITVVLTTPLVVMLARTTYNETTARCPRELLDNTEFPTREDLERHLLGRYVDTVYTPGRTAPSGTALPARDLDQARHWLGFLATGLTRRGTHDLTWWQLPALLHRRTRVLTTIVIYTLAAGLMVGLMVGPVDGFAYGLANGLALGTPFGFALGIVNETGFSRGRAGRAPERLRPHWRRRGRKRPQVKRAFRARAGSEITNGITIGFVVGVALGLGGGPVFGLKGALALGFGNGIVYSLVFILVNLVVAALGEGQDPHDSNPWQLLTTDRSVTVVRTGATTLVVLLLAISLALGSGSPDALVNGLIIGFVLGMLAGMVRLTLSSWGTWLVFTRLWLPLTGRLPWRPKHFLEDAYERGVLRQAGAAYQFRHSQLRDHLAAHHRASRKARAPQPEPAATPQ